MLKRLISKWRQYRYRFVPWIALNLKNRSVRDVGGGDVDKIIPDNVALNQLITLFETLNKNITSNGHTGGLEYPTENVFSTSTLESLDIGMIKGIQDGCPKRSLRNLGVMKKTMGFTTERCTSVLQGGGRGVVVTSGCVPKNTVVSLYPGTIYKQSDPILFQSIGNPFIFRCIDGILIDGNDKGISKFISRSCTQREKIGPYFTADMSWLTEYPANPLAIGQYVNNRSTGYPANVAYQELDVGPDFPFHLRHYLPNVPYSSVEDGEEDRYLRMVGLVSLRDIQAGEELFSSYFTVVH